MTKKDAQKPQAQKPSEKPVDKPVYKPNPNLKPPEYHHVTESYDPKALHRDQGKRIK